jgi:hypothetical protein
MNETLNIKKLSSDHCEMRYIQKTQLRKHMDAIHLKRKDHVCSICGSILELCSKILSFNALSHFRKMLFTRHDAQQAHVRAQGRERHRVHRLWLQNAHEAEDGAAHEITHRRTKLLVQNLWEKISLQLQRDGARQTCSQPRKT